VVAGERGEREEQFTFNFFDLPQTASLLDHNTRARRLYLERLIEPQG